MNEYIYSPSVNAFFPLSLQEDYEMAGTWPQDGVSVSADVAAEYMQSPPPGKFRVAGDGGMPEWKDIPPPTLEEETELAQHKRQQLRARADTEIAWRQDAVDAGIATEGEAKELANWKRYRIQLMRVEVPTTEWPEIPLSE